MYEDVVVRRLRRQFNYEPVWEDWLWCAIVPLAAYTALLVQGVLPAHPGPVLFGIGAVILLILFLGIHNAWDLVTYIAIEGIHQPDEGNGKKE